MNLIKLRKKAGAICSICHSPDYTMTIPEPGEGWKPIFKCGQCGNSWQYGNDGGKYAELSEKIAKAPKKIRGKTENE